MKALQIRPLSPALRDDFLQFFEGPAFADNPRWASCYCQFMQVDHRQVVWAERTAAQNRATACERICSGRMQGWLASHGDEVVGWCQAAPRRLLEAFDDAPPDPEAAGLGQITCFVVSAAHRRTGVATALLQAACEGLRAQGLTLAEARPRSAPGTDADQHQGPLSLYLAAGFEVQGPADAGIVVVRKRLHP